MADRVRAEIAGTKLHHARFGAVRGRQNRAEIQVMRQDDVIPRGSLSHDIRIEGVAFADRSPVRSLDSRRPEEIHPGGRQIHIDQQLHALVSSNSRPSASQAA